MYQKNGQVCDGSVLIKSDGTTVINPTPEMMYEEGWVDYLPVAPEQQIDRVRAEVISDLMNYHTSINVSGFELDGTYHWIPTADRAALRMELEDAMEAGLQVILFYGKVRNIVDVLNMVKRIGVYALICEGVTSTHRQYLEQCTDKGKIERYDYTEGYPEQLKFSF